MYFKVEIEQSMDIDGLCSHLEMNGYNFERIHNHLYVFEDELSYVETIMQDRHIIYGIEGV